MMGVAQSCGRRRLSCLRLSLNSRRKVIVVVFISCLLALSLNALLRMELRLVLPASHTPALSPGSGRFFLVTEHHAATTPRHNATTTRLHATTPPLLLDLKARVDNLTRERLDEALAQVYNLPEAYGLAEPLPPTWPRRCGRYPRLSDLDFNNEYWQVLQTSNGTFYLYNAFFDNRTRTQPGTSVRILGMADRVTPTVTTYCQLWYGNERTPVTAKVLEYRYIWVRAYGNYRQGILQPYLLQCVVPEARRHEVPRSVSLVEGECDLSRNNLRVVHEMPPAGEQKRNFAVCVKGLDIGLDISLRLVEWLELVLLLGADKVFLYDLGVHANVSRVMQHYASLGRVDLRRLTLPGYQPTVRGLVRPYLKAKITHKRQNEVIPYNDCLYRSLNLYRFVVLLDIDEVIMPRAAPDWRQLMRQVAPEVMEGRGNPYSCYYARNVYFLDTMQEPHGLARDVPRFMHMLQHVYRAVNYTGPGSYVKAFHDPQRVLTLHNHFPFSCLPGGCPPFRIPTDVAHLQHYRFDCVGELKRKCDIFLNYTVRDDAIPRLKTPLLQGVMRTLRTLGFLQEDREEAVEGQR